MVDDDVSVFEVVEVPVLSTHTVDRGLILSPTPTSVQILDPVRGLGPDPDPDLGPGLRPAPDHRPYPGRRSGSSNLILTPFLHRTLNPDFDLDPYRGRPLPDFGPNLRSDSDLYSHLCPDPILGPFV